MTSKKDTTGKRRLDLLPFDALTEVARVLEFGCIKYGERNWEEGRPYHEMYGACLRHLFKWYLGEDTDSESKLSHLSHAVTNILMLMSYELNEKLDKEFDTRPEIKLDTSKLFS